MDEVNRTSTDEAPESAGATQTETEEEASARRWRSFTAMRMSSLLVDCANYAIGACMIDDEEFFVDQARKAYRDVSDNYTFAVLKDEVLKKANAKKAEQQEG